MRQGRSDERLDKLEAKLDSLVSAFSGLNSTLMSRFDAVEKRRAASQQSLLARRQSRTVAVDDDDDDAPKSTQAEKSRPASSLKRAATAAPRTLTTGGAEGDGVEQAEAPSFTRPAPIERRLSHTPAPASLAQWVSAKPASSESPSLEA